MLLRIGSGRLAHQTVASFNRSLLRLSHVSGDDEAQTTMGRTKQRPRELVEMDLEREKWTKIYVPKSRSATIHRIRTDGSVDVSIEACLGPNDWNLRFDIERNVALLKRIGPVHLSEVFEDNEEQVETSFDSCLYVQACGIKLENIADPLLLHVGSTFMLRATSDILDSEIPGISALKLYSDVDLRVLEEEHNAIELEVSLNRPFVHTNSLKPPPGHGTT